MLTFFGCMTGHLLEHSGQSAGIYGTSTHELQMVNAASKSQPCVLLPPPVCRWLANWLVEHSPEPPVTSEPPYGTFTPNRKAELWFDAVMSDYLHNSGATDRAAAGATAGVAGSTIYESEDSLPLRAVCEKLRVLRADLTPEDLAGHLGHQEGLQGEEDAQGQEAAEAGREELSLGREEAVRLVEVLAEQVGGGRQEKSGVRVV